MSGVLNGMTAYGIEAAGSVQALSCRSYKNGPNAQDINLYLMDYFPAGFKSDLMAAKQ